MLKTKEIKANTLGEKLRGARESLKMALWQASRKTKIPLRHLKYLEQGNYKELPADVYIIAYLKKYAKALNLDIEEIIEQFRNERNVTENLSKLPRVKSFPVVTPKRLSLVLGIIVIALIFGYFWHQLSYLINPPSIKIVQPVSDFTTQEKSIKVAGQTEADIYLTINGKEVYVDNEGYFQGVVSLELGLNILKIEAKDRLGKTNTIFRKIMVIK